MAKAPPFGKKDTPKKGGDDKKKSENLPPWLKKGGDDKKAKGKK